MTTQGLAPMNGTTDLTVSQRVILAAGRLEAKGHTPFSAEALVVSAWQESPQTFGLKGFAEQHPDSNRVLACVMGERGLARRGWLEKRGQKLYSLSRQGKDEAKRLTEGDVSIQLPKRRHLAKIAVPKDAERLLVLMLTSVAFRRNADGMRREITYADARGFWQLPEAATGETVGRTLDKVQAAIAAAEKAMVAGSVELVTGQIVCPADLDDLTGVHRFLTEQFARHLEQQRKATVRTFRRIG